MISKNERERREFVYDGINALLYAVCDSHNLTDFLDIQGEGEDEMRFFPDEIAAFNEEGYFTIESIENYKPTVEAIYAAVKASKPNLNTAHMLERLEAALRVIDYDLQIMRAEKQKDIDFVNSIEGKNFGELVDIVCKMDNK